MYIKGGWVEPNNLTEIINNNLVNELPEELYQELTKLARSALQASSRSATLDTSAVVHEAIIKIYQKKSLHFASRSHFYSLMSRIMRHMVIDHLRKYHNDKNGGHLQQVNITQLDASEDSSSAMSASEILAMDNAIEALTAMDPALSELIVMRFYGGFELQELANSYGCSESSIKRSLRTARAFLKAHMD